MTKKETEPIILLSAALLFIFLMGILKVADYDVFFHLATGKHILETGQIIHSPDPFSYTSANPMSVATWLTGVVFYEVQNLSGIDGLIIFNAAIITLMFLVLYLNMRAISSESSWNKYLFPLMLLITAFALRMWFFIRPFIFEFLLLSLYFYILNQYRFKGKNYLFTLPLLNIIWVNIHASSIIGVAVALIFLTGEGAKYLLGWNPLLNKKQLAILSFFILLTIAASIVNPIGAKVFMSPFEVLRQRVYMANIGEWQPLAIPYLIGYGFRYTWGFSLLLISAIFVFLYQRKKADLTELIVFCLFLLMAVRSIRFTAEFVIVAAPVIGRGFSDILPHANFNLRRKYRYAINIIFIAALFLIFYTSVFNSKIYGFGLGLKHRVFPVKAVDFLMENKIQGNMYNSIGYGGYLIWRLFPEQKVFIDGRGWVYNETLYKDYLDAHVNPNIWEGLVNKYDIDWVILEYSRDYGKKERMAHLIDNPEWALVYWDREAIVYAKRGSKNNDIIKKFEYKYIRPNNLAPAYLSKYLLENKIAEDIVGELKRNLSLNPDNEESHLSLAYVYFNLRMRNEEFEEMKKVVAINPGLGFAHAAIGEIYMQTGDFKTAEEEFRKALEIDPDDKAATAGLKRLAKK
ncbi:MAG: hypothetical protein A3G39_10205 [Deltaproteobacteria bacterium RIFCSPLOWO2_12_FULL_43_16]|nr:MAG: hypothetical protein A2Z89_03900 [Deltaproteobacteria bacterium GWA2_43_19]OGQ10552.1 MAG: hypothetical protein A3D30_04300 [Deltaproteobacteria bacterium RIFCSPHIGHO2_02_FULL_43_33]OGQ59573.1 MAG: hypothetical protein A3G39_10205 [Deltaproteobacteria bacterium RIFCSPLOWO2_12_FULL_43_16]HBR18546.1 hypothetical protein [Deltaproteobacteria bacterium]